MMISRVSLPPHVRLLLEVLCDPVRCQSLDERSWDVLIRSARVARLLGVLHARLAQQGIADGLGEPIRCLFIAAQMEARFRRQKTLHLTREISPLLAPLGVPLVLLKGAAYVAQGLPMAIGRLPADVDIMLPLGALAEAERFLIGAGWKFEKTDAYDQHYYRAWSHELPPLRRAGQALELDLHHTILPPTGRLHPDAEKLFAASVTVEGSDYRVLSPPDQVLHAAAHLFQDSDCVGRLRDLVDIDALIRHFLIAEGETFWDRLLSAAEIHGLQRPLRYALMFARGWLETPVQEEVLKELTRFASPRAIASVFVRCVSRRLPPIDPDSEPSWQDRIARSALEFRAIWLRMPPWLLAYHASRKSIRPIADWRKSTALAESNR
jgi:hypothetical protein